MSIRVGVAGSGSMGRNHARVYSLLEGATLAAVYDQDRSRAEAVVAEFGGQVAETLGDLAELCDAVSVVVPTEAHLTVGGELLERGVSVLVEKPIASTAEDAEALVRKAAETGRILQVGHIERFNPVLRELEKQLSHPKFIEAHRLSPFPKRSMDIGVVLDLMIHDLEVILHLVSSPIASIDAVGVTVLTRHEDIANARLRFENGCVANITASRISPDRMRKIRVFQEECYLSLDYQEQEGKIYYREGQEIGRKEVEVEKDEPLKLELRAFVESVKEKKEPTVTGQQGAAALEVALEITRLIQEQG
ncbi:MAG: Gfo/Idh/MocA family oxidoreductase [Akkermansiaceae bacterium]|nr:Gfo/Idh/MocA family oxidoreductase [Akkermansiaceae bacterium]